MRYYHIAEAKSIIGPNGIIAKGLIPNVGSRSIIANDYRNAVYMFNNIYTLPGWLNALYPNTNYNNLILLTFELNEQNVNYNPEISESYIMTSIPSDQIKLVRFYNKKLDKFDSLSEAYKVIFNLNISGNNIYNEYDLCFDSLQNIAFTPKIERLVKN